MKKKEEIKEVNEIETAVKETVRGAAVINDDLSFELKGKKYSVPENQRQYLTVGKEYGVVVHQFGMDFYLI